MIYKTLHKLLDERNEKGRRKYGCELHERPMPVPMELVEELLDAAAYAMLWESQRSKLIKWAESVPSDDPSRSAARIVLGILGMKGEKK